MASNAEGSGGLLSLLKGLGAQRGIGRRLQPTSSDLTNGWESRVHISSLHFLPVIVLAVAIALEGQLLPTAPVGQSLPERAESMRDLEPGLIVIPESAFRAAFEVSAFYQADAGTRDKAIRVTA